MKYGKLPRKCDYRTLRMGRYLKDLAPPPDSYSVLQKICQILGIPDVTTLFPMDGNDQYGDCTIAALAHAITTFQALLKSQVIMAEADVIALYNQLTGGQDTGMAELDVLNYWRKNAVDGDEILAYVSIDPRNHDHVKQAIQLFGGVYLGFQVTEECETQFSNGNPWTAGTLTNDGHAVFAVEYDADGVTVLTWGGTQKGGWDWWDQCVDEAYALLPPEASDPAFCPGFDITTLQTDLAAISGGVSG